MEPSMPLLRLPALVAAVALGAVLSGCATPSALPAGSTEAAVRQQLGAPTGEWPAGAGGRVLEYATGPFGKQTHLLDFGADGRLRAVEQVLTEARFAGVRVGMDQAALRQWLGRASERFRVARPVPQTVWAYRYEVPHCQWFMVGVGDDGRVVDTAYGPDPLCEVLDGTLFPN
jgi:hypothetical protein